MERAFNEIGNSTKTINESVEMLKAKFPPIIDGLSNTSMELLDEETSMWLI